jgi:hypothetical protein
MKPRRNTSKAPTAADFAEIDAAIDEAMKETPDPVSPCIGCRHETRCVAEGLCCGACALFRRGLPEARYRIAPRVPSKAIAETIEELARRPRRKPRPRGETLWGDDAAW